MVEAIRDQWVIAAGVVVLVAAFLVWLIEPTLERAPWLYHHHAQ